MEKGYQVHVVICRSASYNKERLKDFLSDEEMEILLNNNNFTLHYSDVTDALNITKLIADIQPDKIYSLAAQSHIYVSFDMSS